MFIPWEQLEASGVLEVQGAATVAQLRDRLLALGGSAQHLSALVIHLADGRVVPTVVAQVKELAKKHGRSILQKRLEALAGELCPQPWETAGEPPDYQHAESLAAQRRLPVVVTLEGQRVGLARPTRESTSSPEDGAFDLFDLSVPGRDRSTFVWFPANATLAHAARELIPHRETYLVYVVLQVAPGKFSVADKRELNAALQRLAAQEGLPPQEFWALPLSRLEDAFEEAQVRKLEDVSGKQARQLSGWRYLVLTQDGAPEILYPKRVLSGTLATPRAKSAAYDLDTVPVSVLEGILDVSVSSQEPETQPRFVNIWFEDPQQERLDPSRPLVMGDAYHLALDVGRLRRDSIVDWERTPGGPKAIVEPQEREAYLYVSLFSMDFEINQPTQALRLPQAEDSDLVRFEVTPQRRSQRDPARLELCLYYRTYLVQTFEVLVEVVAAGERPRSPRRQSARLTHARSASFPEMERLPPRDLSLTITRDSADRYRFTFLVDPDPSDEGAASRAVELSCYVQLTRDDLTHLITKARRQLYNVVQTFDLLQDHDIRTYRKATRALAQVGRQLYLKLFEASAASALAAWMEDSLPTGSTLQIVDLAGDFVFPWSLVYTAPPWDDDKEIDVEHFWGWRYKLVILTSTLLDTYRQAPTEMASDEPLQVSVGLYERLVGAAQQKTFFAELAASSGEQIAPKILTDRRRMSRALEAADRDLYYFFCHGFTERIATDIQLDADLEGLFARLAADDVAGKTPSIREHLDDLFDVSDSWLRLTRGKIPLTMLKETVPGRFTRHPVVFLNMCQSAQVLPSLSDGFVPFFIRRGARAVVGTECSMNTIFADSFARAFLTRFFQGEAVGDILLALRQNYLKDGNPLALAYTLFADADLRLSESLLPYTKTERREPMTDGQDRRDAVEVLWDDDMDGLMMTLAARTQAEEAGFAKEELELWEPPEEIFTADVEAGPEWTAKMVALGEKWWEKLEPELYKLLCDRQNKQHGELMKALGDGAKMLAVALAPALVAQVAALPAVAIVAATIAAKKIADTGLQAACELWAESLAKQENEGAA